MAHRWSLLGDFADPREVGNTLQVSRIMPPKKSAALNRANGRDHIGNPSAAFDLSETAVQCGLYVRERITAFERITDGADAVFYFAHLLARLTVFSGDGITVTREFRGGGKAADRV